jgi:hypothetical protein
MPQPPSTRFHVPAALRQGLDPTFPTPIGQSPVCRSSLVKSRYWVNGRRHESTVPAFEAVLERLTDQIRAHSGCHYSCVQNTTPAPCDAGFQKSILASPLKHARVLRRFYSLANSDDHASCISNNGMVQEDLPNPSRNLDGTSTSRLTDY